MGDEETLRRLVLRARQVHAPSIVQDWNELLRHAPGSFDGRFDLARWMTITRRLPADEDDFESLASRVRRLTANSEPVYYAKVFDAIERLVGEADVEDALRARVRDFRHVWDASEILGTRFKRIQCSRLVTTGLRRPT